jgi:hypothetical protein
MNPEFEKWTEEKGALVDPTGYSFEIRNQRLVFELARAINKSILVAIEKATEQSRLAGQLATRQLDDAIQEIALLKSVADQPQRSDSLDWWTKHRGKPVSGAPSSKPDEGEEGNPQEYGDSN